MSARGAVGARPLAAAARVLATATRASSLAAAAIAFALLVGVGACAPGFAPAGADVVETRSDGGARIELGREPIEQALDELGEACARGESYQGECAAKAKDACAGMTHVARACFDAAEPKATCDALQNKALAGAEKRALGARGARAVADLCEAACETRQNGGRWNDMREALDALCPSRAP